MMGDTFLRKIWWKKIDIDFGGCEEPEAALARSLSERAHLYIWHEPLNYIDIYSRMQIERLISDSCPTMIFVEHDAGFVRAAATDIVEL